jgi:hypothetical protein
MATPATPSQERLAYQSRICWLGTRSWGLLATSGLGITSALVCDERAILIINSAQFEIISSEYDRVMNESLYELS